MPQGISLERRQDLRIKVFAALGVGWLAFALAGAVAVRATATAGSGVTATATILSRETVHGVNRATVEFPTPNGEVTTSIAICHHQSYPVGGTVVVRYSKANPVNAWERDMPPRPALRVPLALFAIGELAGLAIVLTAVRSDPAPQRPFNPSDGDASGPDRPHADGSGKTEPRSEPADTEPAVFV